MASILQIGSKWRAQVRIAGHRPKTKTFATLDEARAWAFEFEKEARANHVRDDIYSLPRFRPNYQYGIYFLFLSGVCVYVGQSKKPHARVHEHIGVIAYDEFAILPCAAESMNTIELHYIKKLKPAHNKKGAVESVPAHVRKAERIKWWKDLRALRLLRAEK